MTTKFNYNLKAHETEYRGILFRSRLEAKWAAFFDLVGWKWEYEPFDLAGWSPDFAVSFPCGHSDCSGSHELLIEVKPFFNLSDFDGMPCLDYSYGGFGDERIPADSSAAFGINPHVTWWEFAHGAGGGEENLEQWLSEDLDLLWQQAGVKVRDTPQLPEEDPQISAEKLTLVILDVLLHSPVHARTLAKILRDVEEGILPS